ncbi:hypothetical protein C8R47DRAFT_1200889 [Mycena vitilis]|nr:hypothetical protein C8R47DRAFT_1329880 [Mycena vitilis]KAJ6468481.1 hypothetical protein C8R47DRAFT_1200889 [Mycena vitilis]
MNDNNMPEFPEPNGEFVLNWAPTSSNNAHDIQDMEGGYSFDDPAVLRAHKSGSRIDIIPPTPVEGSVVLFQSHESLVYDVQSSRGFQLPSASPEPSRQRDGYQAESGYNFHSYGAISEPRPDIPDKHSSGGASCLDTSQVDGTQIWDASPNPFTGQSKPTFGPPFDHTPSTSNFDAPHGGGRRRASFTFPTQTSEFLSGRASPVVSRDGFLYPYGAASRHRRSKSDSARPVHEGSVGSDSMMFLSSTESPPLISAYRRHARSVSSDGSAYSERSVTSPQWPSQYPSPDVSPQSNCSYLPEFDDFSGTNIALPTSVAKRHVGSERTVQASQNRRKDVGRHTCPVPGCGSTFTRRVNLKGHLRAHNDERPFACGWDGCDRAFARLHDRKRHEQLHNVYRPFACEGCGKQFARLDALNRHLRTKGAEGCHQVMDPAQRPGGEDELGQRISRFAL